MSLTGTRTRLETLTRELLRNWDDTKTAWKDAKAEEFERRYLLELAARVDRTAVLLDQLDKVLTRVKDDCE
jgi:thymidylate synthase